MKNINYITIQGWMINELSLSGNEVICYAIIYGFSQDGQSEFGGSLSYIAESLGITKENARKVVSRLVEGGFIIKRDIEVTKGIKVCKYKVNTDMIPELTAASKQSRGGTKTTPDNNIDNNRKEEIDKSISKKEMAQELINLWNNETKDFPKVRKASPDIINSIDKMLKRGYSYEDMKKAVILCNSLSDFYKGKERGKTWKATFQWLIHNTNDNFDKIVNGALHTSQEQQRIYQSVMDEGVEAQLNKYNPYTEGYHLWLNENDGKYYFTGNIINLADGYTKDNRPNGAQVHQNGYTYTWNATSKEWERG